MSAPWIAVVVCLWVTVIALILVVVGVLRRAAAALESLRADGFSTRDLPAGPPAGSRLPAMEVRRTDGSELTLAELPGPYVLAVLTSHCSPCQGIAERLRKDPETLARLDGMMVLTDPDGPERLGLADKLTMLVDPASQITASLDLPGTPFAIAVGADGTVLAAQLLAGTAQLISLLDAVRASRELDVAGA